MKKTKLKKDQRRSVSIISFISISIAWTMGFTAQSIVEVISKGKTNDLGVIIFWSALFVLIAWALAIRLPLIRISLTSHLFSRIIFPFVSVIYANFIFIIMIGWLFIKTGFLSIWVVPSVVGLTFGIVYSQIIRNPKWITLIKSNRLIRYSMLSTSLIYCLITLVIFPFIAPSTAFRFMPDNVRDHIVKKTILQYAEGDSYEELKKDLPGYFSSNNPSHMSSFGDFSFRIKAKDGIITQLQIKH